MILTDNIKSINQINKLNLESITFRCATLTFDSMSVQPALRFDQSKDFVVGFEDLRPYRTGCDEVCNLLLVFMLTGNFRSWKLPVAYYLTSHSVTPQILLQILMKTLSDIHSSGIEVTSVVCDMESQQMSCFLTLLKVSPEKPYFKHPITKGNVFALFDMPHILKCIRNNLISYDFVVSRA